MKAITSYQSLNTSKFESAAIMIIYANPNVDVVMVHHDSFHLSESFVVTSFKENQIIKLNNQPARTYLIDQLDLPHVTPRPMFTNSRSR